MDLETLIAIRKNFAQKLQKEIDKKYASDANSKRRIKFSEDFSAQKFDITKSYRKWFNYTNLPNEKTKLALCDFFDCDEDYLFGKQEYPRREKISASEETGLKYDTIESISSMPSGYKTVIDALVEENCIESLFNVMSEWVSDSYTEVRLGKPGNVRILSSEEAKRLFSYKIDTEMRSIVNYLLHNKDMMNTLIRTYQYNNRLQVLNNYKELLSDPKQSGQQKEIKKHIKAIEEELNDIMKKDYYTEWNK